MSIINEKLKYTTKEEYCCSWQVIINEVADCMNDIAHELKYGSVNISEKPLEFGGTNIDIILRGDLKKLADKTKHVSAYLYDMARAIYHTREIDYELKKKLYEVVNSILTPVLIGDSEYKIINFNLSKYEKDLEYKKPTFWQKLFRKTTTPNDYLKLYIRVDKKK